MGVLSKAAKLKTENFASAWKKDGRPSNSQKLLLPFVDLCHLCDWFSRYMDSALSYIFFTVINFDMKKESENLIFFLFFFFIKSFQPRINWQRFLCQLRDQWIFLPEYPKYWTGTKYSRRKRLWPRLSRNSLMFFVQRGCLPWCQRQISVWTPPIGQV